MVIAPRIIALQIYGMDINDEIVRLHAAGLPQREIWTKLGCSSYRVRRALSGCGRNRSEAMRLAWDVGRCRLTEERRLALRKAAHLSIRASRKFWTKPEQVFCRLLAGIGLGVRFPAYVKEILNVPHDEAGPICFQFPIQRYVCDFVHPVRRLVFRVQGDFWHANPLLYQTLNTIQQHNVRQDKNCRIYLEKHGWQVYDFWASDITWRPEYVKALCAQLVSGPVLQTGGSGFEPQEGYLDWSEKLRALWFKPKRIRRPEKPCAVCGKEFRPRKRKLSYCSPECAAIGMRKVVRPDKQQLARLLWDIPTSKIAERLGVSDKTVTKWAKRLGLAKPGPGYWARQRTTKQSH